MNRFVAAFLLIPCLVSLPAQAARKKAMTDEKRAVVIPPIGETFQLPEEDIMNLWEVMWTDVESSLQPVGYTMVERDKKMLNALKKATDTEDLGRRMKATIMVIGEGSSAGAKHSVALRGLNILTGKVVAATDINGKDLNGLKHSWSVKKDAFLETIKTSLSAGAEQPAASADKGGDGTAESDAEAEADQKLGKQQSKDLKKLCDAGQAEACTARGYMYYSGKGVRKNRGTARDLLGKGCDKGDGTGCLLLGVMYAAGDGVDADPDKAAELINKACEMGTTAACKYAKREKKAVNAY